MSDDFIRKFGYEPFPEEYGWLHSTKKLGTVVCCAPETDMIEACKQNNYEYIHVSTRDEAIRAKDVGLTPLLWTGSEWKEFVVRPLEEWNCYACGQEMAGGICPDCQ